MPPVDERDLRDLARHLANLYQELDSLKYSRPTPPEVRAMKPAPGPQSPGNWLYVSCWLDQEPRLREVAFNAFSDIGVKVRDDEAGAVALCQKLAFHAQAVSELDWASDLTDELEHQAKVIGRHCRPRDDEAGTVDDDGEVWLTARTICYKLQQMKFEVKPELLRKWVERGVISARPFSTGKNVFNLQEVLNVVRSRNSKLD
ncbi:TPA: hypothetical protein NBQ01_002150 [Corynebacterium striatum]|nr:hypothetical protein [Corynebacterium striatum]